jgi:arylsulfatase A-like enzyme
MQASTRRVKNALFIMCDQLRADYLSCYGHPTLQTPTIDALARRGTRYTRAYVQSPVCGPSRMSFYTGRYVQSHGASWNFYPPSIGERTLGDYLRPQGIRTAVVGKTHFKVDQEALTRLGVPASAVDAQWLAHGGFEAFGRDDGVHPDGRGPLDFAYNNWLRSHGYEATNPWHDFANSAQGPDGKPLSGWQMRHACLPARVREEHSETAYATDRAMDFMREQADRPWCLHLSYIKPHWPYMAPAPYHAMYGPDDISAAVRGDHERASAHPVHAAFMRHEEAVSFSREEVRRTVIPTYMGLIRQIDDHLGRLFAFMEAQGLLEETLIVFTSDHGDYLGDHWLGEKELFHEPSVRVPLIVVHPGQSVRGQVSDALVEAIDVVPTLLEALGVAGPNHVLEGQSLLPNVLDGAPLDREAVFSEIDYATYQARHELSIDLNTARGAMVRNARWKYIHWQGFAPQLFDLLEDPNELNDLGTHAAHAAVRAEMQQQLFDWMWRRKSRITVSDDMVRKRASARDGGSDVHIGFW